MTIALLDADILCYRVGFTTQDIEEEDVYIVEARVDGMMRQILMDIGQGDGTIEYHAFLTDSKGNFRLELYPEYKSSRPKEKPRHYAYIKAYLQKQWGAEVVWGQEADDALGIYQTRYGDNSIIASIDKDLFQIPGHHYNIATRQFSYVDSDMAIRWFYRQLLMGDRVDDIPGIKGLGKERSHKIIDPLETEWDMWQEVLRRYEAAGMTEEQARTNGILLWCRRRMSQYWEPPTTEPDAD